MVTYLLAFAIGDLSYVERKTKRGIPVRIYTTTFQINNANYAANITHQIIDYFEEYFNIHYPLPKLGNFIIKWEKLRE
jgi:aminopeptidase N